MNVILQTLIVFIQSIAAGLSISLGGALFVGSKFVFTYADSKWSEFGTLIGSDLFSVGLIIVCAFRLMLYTGKIGLMFETCQGGFYFFSLIVMLIGNLGSAYGAGLLLNYLLKNSRFVVIDTSVAEAKLNLSTVTDYVKCVMQSMFCGSCVHIGVKCFNMFRNVKGAVITNFAVLMFVYSGFQHCIANTFYFGCAKLFNTKVLINVAICVVGNSLGTIPIALFTSTFHQVTPKSSTSSLDNTEESLEDNRSHRNKSESSEDYPDYSSS